MYGAGVIEDIQEKVIDGKTQNYYVMQIPVGNLKIMVSTEKAKNDGLRPVYTKEEVLDILNIQTELKSTNTQENWNQRNKENLEKIKTGQLLRVLEVYRNLIYREREKGLSSAEKKILTTVKQIILSELIVTQGVNKPEAEEMLVESFLNCCK
jgi:CarD family transcriptional regulator